MNHQILSSISSVAIWGSLLSALMLGVFSLIQGVFNGRRNGRNRYIVLGLVSIGAACVDLCHPYLSIKVYEALRIAFWGAYGPAIIGILFQSRVIPILLFTSLVAVGLTFCLILDSALGSSFVIPTTFLIAAGGFGLRWRRDGGYAISILTATSLSQGVSSILYLPVVLTGNDVFITLGYLHFAIISILGVALGWVHLPLELAGKNPVRVSRRQFTALVFTILAAELITLPSLAYGSMPLEGYAAGTLLQLSALMAAFLLHRHDLVIFTDDVRQLLAKRTQSLTATKEKLKNINAEQAKILAEQASEIIAKTAVIERQRRLELVAETTGQVAHDIQNIAVPMLRLTASDRDFDLGDLERLRYHVKELLDLNDQLLTLSSRRRARLRPLLIQGAIKSALTWFTPDELKIIELGCTEKLWVNGIEPQLARAVGNLAKNALDAVSKANGKIRLGCHEIIVNEPRRCFLGDLYPGNYVSITVSDNGHGIPVAIREKIFDPYFSVKPSGQSGTGLGLPIVSSIVRDHGGIIDLKSDETGTCFEILLPAIQPQPTYGHDDKMYQNEAIGVLDCNTQSAQLVRNWLQDSGVSHKIFDSLTELYHATPANNFKIILISKEITSPAKHEILFALKNLSPHSEVRFFSTETSAEEDKSGALDSVISSREELLALLAPHCSPRRETHPQIH